MINLKLLAIFAVLAVSSAKIEIPANYKLVSPNLPPKFQQNFERKYPKAFASNNTGIEPYIIGGQVAERGQFPYQVLLYTFKQSSVNPCGGSLIKRDWVLTAAHCVYGDFDYVSLYFGVVNIDAWESISWETKVAPPDVHVHPEFEWFYLSNDIALIEVKNAPLNLLEDLFVDTIALPYPLPDFDFTGWTGTVSGFGVFSDEEPRMSTELKYNYLTAISNEECASSYMDGLVRDTNICAETSATASVCSGDSGGPYTFTINSVEYLIGITSFGSIEGCEKGFPAGFTRVTKYIDWIESTMSGVLPTPPPPEINIKDLIKQILKKIMEIFFGRSIF